MTPQQLWEWFATLSVWQYRIHSPPDLPNPFFVTAVVVLIAVAYLLGTRTKAAARERKMRREREQHVKMRIGDAIVEGIEDLVHKGELKRDEAGFWYRRLGHVLTLPDVLSKNTKALKEQLKEKHKGKTKTNVTTFKPIRRKATS